MIAAEIEKLAAMPAESADDIQAKLSLLIHIGHREGHERLMQSISADFPRLAGRASA
jgi:hypothetical protein